MGLCILRVRPDGVLLRKTALSLLFCPSKNNKNKMKYYYNQKSPIKKFLAVLMIFMVGWTGAFFYYDVGEIIDIPDYEYSEPEDVTEEVSLELFWDVWEILDESYIDVTLLNDQEMLYGAVDGMVDALGDPYTDFMTPEETADFLENMGGELEGIGAELTVEDGQLVIISPIKGAPAEEFLLPGDVIYLIDGEYASDMTILEAVMNIRGEPGTTVELTIMREGEEDYLVFEIERDTVEIDSVEWEFAGENSDIAYISIYQFGDKTSDEFQEAVNEVLLHDVSGIIVDMRNNGGGYLETSVDVLSEFLDGKEKAVTVKMRDESENELHYTSGSSKLIDIPLVVLVNEGSASASEIVAGAIQDYEVGVIIGEQTFGKGSVQVIEELSDGASLRITIAKWYTPAGRSIDDTGVTPDILVMPDYETDEDEQLDEAISYLESL